MSVAEPIRGITRFEAQRRTDAEHYMQSRTGLYVRPGLGVGDALQFSSVPENYFRTTGYRIHDISKEWFFDHNPFVIRGDTQPLERTFDLWNFPKKFEWPVVRPESVYLSNAEIFAGAVGAKTVLNRPRLYQFEDFPFHKREMILLHIDGRSHGDMPDHVLAHVLKKYVPTKRLYQIGNSSFDLGIPKFKTATLWDLAEIISQAQMFIGMDSGPSWIAACFPDIVTKKLRTKPSLDALRDWVPLSRNNVHSFWDDRCHQIFNVSEEDVGFTSTYRKI